MSAEYHENDMEISVRPQLWNFVRTFLYFDQLIWSLVLFLRLQFWITVGTSVYVYWIPWKWYGDIFEATAVKLCEDIFLYFDQLLWSSVVSLWFQFWIIVGAFVYVYWIPWKWYGDICDATAVKLWRDIFVFRPTTLKFSGLSKSPVLDYCGDICVCP